MKLQTILFSFLFAFSISACTDNPDEGPSLPEYSITIHSPNVTEVNAGETLQIHVDFDEPNELTVHHVNIQLTTDSGEVLYDGPNEAHVHVDGGHHEHHADVVIDSEAGTEVTITAKVWGHSEGIAEQTMTRSFTVK